MPMLAATPVTYRHAVPLPADLPAPATTVAAPRTGSSGDATYVARDRYDGLPGSTSIWARGNLRRAAGTDFLAAVAAARDAAEAADANQGDSTVQALTRAKDGTFFIAPAMEELDDTSQFETMTLGQPFEHHTPSYAPSAHGALQALVGYDNWVDTRHA